MSISAISGSSSPDYTSQTQTQTTPHHRHGLPSFEDTASLLGISTGTLAGDMQSGDTLSSLASTAGVSSSDLLSAVEQDLKSSAPGNGPTLDSHQLSQMATNIINGVQPGTESDSSSASTGATGDQASAPAAGAVSDSPSGGPLYDIFA